LKETVKHILLALAVAVALPAAVLGTSHPPERSARLITADQPTPTTTTIAPEPQQSTTPTTPTSDPPKRHEEPHPATTTTTETVHKRADHMTIACTSGSHGAQVGCEWGGVSSAADRLVLMREEPGSKSEPIWSTNDVDATRHIDDSAETGVTYVYRISSYRDDQFLETSNPARVRAGGGTPTTAATPTTAPRHQTTQQWYIRMSCSLGGDHSVVCTWAEPPVAVAAWRIVRRHAGDDEIPIPTTHERRITDPTADADTSYTYVLNGYDGDGRSVVLGSAKVTTGSAAPTTTTTTEVGCCASGADRR
jgi:hypothetical protein